MVATIKSIFLLILVNVCTTRAEINLFRKNTCTSFLAYPLFLFDPRCYHNPDAHSDIPTLITRHGYNVEMHSVSTPDGFYLHLYRIPGEGQPIYLQHLVAMNGNIWVDKGNRSLAFKLADKGYDVWIGTIRSATYGSEHATLTKSDNAFWDFTLDIHGDEDIPLSLETIANVTGKGGDIIYIGHGTGCGLMLMFAAWQPERASKLVKGIVGLAPAAYLDGSPFIDALSPFTGLFTIILRTLGIRGLYVHEKFLQSSLNIACRFVPHLCMLVPMRIIFGPNSGEFIPEDLLLYFSAWPVSTSIDEHLQLLQIGRDKKFQRFDYGEPKNKKLYGQAKPPSYDLGKIKMPVYIFYGKKDGFSVVKNMQRLYNELGSEKKELIEISTDGRLQYNHVNFVYSKDANTLLYPRVFKVLEENLA